MPIFQSWAEVVRIALTSVLAYAALILYVRIAGIRSISKMNNFDWVTTVAAGSAVASTILFEDVVLVDGLVAIFTLLGAQYVVVRLSIRSDRFMHAVHTPPVLLFYDGDFLNDVMRRERVLHSEIMSAVRAHGHSDLSKISAVVLEPDASLSVISQSAALDSHLFARVKHASVHR